jgi:uncharacterized iron-regulated membrane protein
MVEASLRKWHRWMGISLAVFIFLQALSGLVLNLEDLFEIAAVTGWSNVLHRGGSDFGTVYRTLLGLGLIGMAVSGSLIFYKIWQRTRKK